MPYDPVRSYISENWPRSFRRDSAGSGFAGIDLPHPYTTPSIKGEGHFSFFFYWDTRFTNLGLLRDGHAAMAADNIRNIAWFIRRQGYMPNHTGIFNRSQPPLFARMLLDYREATGDDTLLAECAAELRQEYHFWTTARHTPTGLQRYGHHETAEGCARFFDRFAQRRLGHPADLPPGEKTRLGGHYLGEAESGWDFTPRFAGRCLDFNPVDLNALLHDHEILLGEIGPELGWDDAALWNDRAITRRNRVQDLLWDETDGWFHDYDFVEKRRSSVAHLGGLLPLLCGLATPEQAARAAEKLPLFERAHGIAATVETPDCRRFQWAYPNVWPPLVCFAVEALRRHGLNTQADGVARQFLDTTARLFAETGRLWEKTDAETGVIAANEYAAAPMLGWTAGAFVALHENLSAPRNR